MHIKSKTKKIETDINSKIFCNQAINQIRMILPFRKKTNTLNSLPAYNDRKIYPNKDDIQDEWYHYYDNDEDSRDADVVYNLYGK